ncbi:MAG TPA: tyrosine-type recombinase/integrase [Stellaceae bacterium]|nr:tyrosine-type recombinase/integrase [Stellaceae bacterium]
MPKITKRLVDALRPEPGRDVFKWDAGDGALKGFGLRVKSTGAASYFVQYRNEQGRTRRLVLGRVGELTPDEARELAADKLGQVRKGGDPSADRHAARKSMTVTELADLYLRDGPAEKPNKKLSSWVTDRSNIERHIVPLLGRKLAKGLTPADVARFQTDIAKGKSATDIKTGFRGRAIVEGGKGIAARTLAVLAAMLQFGVARGALETNPAKGVRPFKGEKKVRFLSESEVSRLADTLNALRAERMVSPAALAAIRLLLLTGCRKGEILTLKWEYIDFDRGCLNLPDSKTGAKTVPLAAAALELLAEIPQVSSWVIPAASGTGHFVGLQKAWKRVRTRAGFPDLRLHDLRHSFASFAVADGATLYMVGKVLGHRQSRTTEVYAHLSDDPLRALANRTAARIASAMKGAEAGAKILPIRGRAETA